MRVANHANLSSSDLASIEKEVADHRSLPDLLNWARVQPPGTLHPQIVAGVVTQDEYTHDVIVPWGDGLVLVYDTT
ncbi:MAG TPA: hypothetical protein VJ302_11005 [Blastocatellia bacterium]|nr:hypothetical protein [Blastocatellia bacterium]